MPPRPCPSQLPPPPEPWPPPPGGPPWPAKEEEPRRFLDPETIARISRLDLRARHVVEGFIAGMHKSPFFGHSVEFIQHREYVAGGHPRHPPRKGGSEDRPHFIQQE